jgi:subtilase family serine protease
MKRELEWYRIRLGPREFGIFGPLQIEAGRNALLDLTKDTRFIDLFPLRLLIISQGGSMNRRTRPANADVIFQWLSCVAVVIAMTCVPLSASAVDGKLIANSTPSYVATAKNLGAEDPAKVIEVSIWLQLHNRSEFDALTQSLYDRTSPNYHHWLKPNDIAARFAPTAQEAKTVQQFLAAHNLTVVKTGPNNFYVRARGTVGDVEKAFHVQLNNYQVGEKTIRANAGDPYVEGPAGSLVRAISGLDSAQFEHTLLTQPTKLRGSKGAAAKPAAVSDADFYSSQCFTGTETESFSTNGDGELPIGTYSGNKLNLQSQNSPGCGYTPSEIQTAYNLTSLYNEGYDGTGQTIAIVDWCGSFSIQSDANKFSTKFGLPKLTSSNFAITYTAPSECIAYDQVEINLDVEWAHVVAPGASINLVVPPSASFQDVDDAEFDVAIYGLGNVLSGSYGSPEALTAETELDTENLISEIGAAAGISFNFATGDDGNYALVDDVFLPTVNAPADSPWSTGVGGVTLALNSDNSIAWQAGWGNNVNVVAAGGVVADPPVGEFFGGSGGGPSNCVTKHTEFRRPICTGGFPRPSYQKGFVPGKYRQLPDVSWLADPFTGAVILISIPGQVPEQVYQVVGGTSLATPMFSALWAIANQEALAGGGTELGQAAPYLYTLPAGTISDIVPVTSATNVTGSVQDSHGTKKYSAPRLAGATPTEHQFVSALWDIFTEEETAAVVSFGTDPGLKIATGWDEVTGVGTPNAQAFADFFYAQ